MKLESKQGIPESGTRTGSYLVQTGIPRILVLSGPRFGNFCWPWSEPVLIRSGPDRPGPIGIGPWIPNWTYSALYYIRIRDKVYGFLSMF